VLSGRDLVDVFLASGEYLGATLYDGRSGETIVTIAGPGFRASSSVYFALLPCGRGRRPFVPA
jgi:hypothetical protein